MPRDQYQAKRFIQRDTDGNCGIFRLLGGMGAKFACEFPIMPTSLRDRSLRAGKECQRMKGKML